MVKLTLGNFNQDSSFKQAIIDIGKGSCIVDDGEEIAVGLLATTMDFSHPLLTHPVLSSPDHSYVYEYDDFAGLLAAVKFVYATLIQSTDPLACEFMIAPSVNYVSLKNQNKIPLSIDYKKKAREEIGIEQLNSMISRFNGFDFQYQDNIVVEQKITLTDLPVAVNGDLFYQTDLEIARFCQQGDDIGKFEMRYINRFIGFGVFAREDIPSGELIAQYCGLKNHAAALGGPYVYAQKNDALNLRINAMHVGNMARFINHAPKNINVTQDKPPLRGLAKQSSSPFQLKIVLDCFTSFARTGLSFVKTGFLRAKIQKILVSNVKGEIHGLYGNDVVIYRSIRTISKGEQLLVDYGKSYFPRDINMFSIKHNGNIIDSANKKVKESRKQRQHSLRLMSDHGIKEAQWALVRKPLIILISIVLFALFNGDLFYTL